MAQGQTIIDLKVNARDVQRLGETTKKAFDPKSPRDLTRATRDLVTVVRELQTTLRGVTTELGRQRTGVDVMRSYRDATRDTRQEVAQLRQEMERLRGAAGGGGGGQGGGGAGGWGARGGGGGVRSPRISELQVPMVDAGALAGALGSIPILGAIGAGGLMASYQMYGSALRYQQARLSSWSTLGARDPLTFRMTQQGYAGHWSGAPGSAVADARARVSAAGGSTFLGHLYKGADYVTGGYFDGIHGAATAYDRALAAGARASGHTFIPGRPTLYNQSFSTGGLEGVGVRYGVAPAQTLQEAHSFAQALGSRYGRGFGDNEFEAAKAAQLMFGMDLGQSGRFMQNAGATTQAGGELLARSIGNAVVLGLDGSKIGEYLQNMSGLLQAEYDRGRTGMDVGSLLAMDRAMVAAGLSGSVASSTSIGFAQAAAGLGRGGGSPAMQYAAMAGIGWRPGDDPFAAMERLQNPAEAINALPSILRRVVPAGGDPNSSMSVILGQRILSQLGVDMAPEGVRSLLGSVMDNGLTRGPGESGLTMAGLIGAGAENAGPAAGILRGEAAQEARRIGVGFEVSGQVQGLNDILIKLGQTVQNVAGGAIETLIGAVGRLGDAAVLATAGMGGGPSGSGAGGGK